VGGGRGAMGGVVAMVQQWQWQSGLGRAVGAHGEREVLTEPGRRLRFASRVCGWAWAAGAWGT